MAAALQARLDVVVVRRIGEPFQEELGVGAIAGDDPPLFDERAPGRFCAGPAGPGRPDVFRAAGPWYEDFEQLTGDDMLEAPQGG